jgi:uncharacterized protein YukE
MTTGVGYQVQPEAVRAIVGRVSSILMQIYSTVQAIERLVLPPSAFATIGSPVASANTTAQSQVAQTLRSLLSVLQQTNSSVNQAANGYTTTDQQVAQSLNGQPTAATAGSNPVLSPPVTTPVTTPVTIPVATGTPGSVGTVVNYLATTRGGSVQTAPPVGVTSGSPVDFVRWLNTTGHQLDAGVVTVYSGDLASGQTLSGVAHPGDVVVLQPAAGMPGSGGGEIGVVGADGQLYNNGPIGTATGPASAWVYRPMNATASLW